MKDASKIMASAVGGISHSQNESIVSLQNKVTIVESKLEKIDSGMKTILDFIKNK